MNKKGFTLVELLAVIAILGMLIAMVTPNLMDMFDEKKDTLYENTISEIERVASIYLTDNPDIYSDISKNGYVNISINTLCNEKYLTCPVKNQKDNSDIDGYVKVTFEDNNYVYRFVNNNYVNENVKLEVYLNGGNLSNNLNGTYKEGTIIELENPTKVNGNFKGWRVVKGNSTIIDNKLTIGSRDTIIYAQWEATSNLTIDLDEGSVSNNQSGKYKSGIVIELEEPTKEGYLFLGWEVIEGDSILSGNKLTIGNINSKVKALWKFNKYNLIVELNGGTTNQQFTEKYEAGITIELENPTKEGYTFAGWTTDNGIVSGSTFTMGSVETTVKANWKGNKYTVTFNSGNLIYDLNNVDNVTYDGIIYSVDNGVVAVTSNRNDGYGFINARVYLESGKTYIFRCDTDGSWGWYSGEDTVEIFLMLNGKYNTIIHISSNIDFKFTPTQTGVYYLRLDVNLEGKTHTFSNINISAVASEKSVIYNEVYGELPTPTREGYVFLGWYTEATEGEQITESSRYNINGNQTLYAHWENAEFEYTGDYQKFTIPYDGYYNIELWGASGGNSTSTTGGKGAYSSGKIYMNKGENLYLYLGGSTTTLTGGYNGGGTGANQYNARGGGGASDVRYFGSYQPSESDLFWNSTIGLNSRIMISGGGGGADNYSSGSNGGVGGTLVGGDGSYYRLAGSSSTYIVSKGGTQSAGGASGSGASSNEPGSFGQGGSSNNSHGGGGGAGYYGGGAGSYNGSVVGSGAGGSSFISGYAGVNTITSSTDRTHTNNTLHYSNKYFIDGEMQLGVNSGNGKAKITYVGNTIEKKNDKLNNVRYIKDCINGNSANQSNHWVELQAISNGLNVAYGKTVTSTSPPRIGSETELELSALVDSSFDTSKYIDLGIGLQCVTVDLERTYKLDEIAVWHYYGDGRSYNNHSLFVSSNNNTWTIILDNVSGVSETANGIRVSAYD